MRVVITGPTGAIGHALIEQCIKNGDEVLAICRKGSSRIKTLPLDNKVAVLELSLCDYDDYINETDAPDVPYDVFYHFAWESTTGASRNDTDSQSLNIRYALSAVKLASFLGCKTSLARALRLNTAEWRVLLSLTHLHFLRTDMALLSFALDSLRVFFVASWVLNISGHAY